MTFEEDFEINDEKARKVQADQAAKTHATAVIFHRVFTSEEGHKVLEYWHNKYTMQSVLNGHSTQFEAGIREGQNSVIREIISFINLAQNPRSPE